MKKNLITSILALLFGMAASAGPLIVKKIRKSITHGQECISADPCMEAYNASASALEVWYDWAVGQCYRIYQFPYNSSCHSHIIHVYSYEQDWNFDQLVICQNGMVAKPKDGQ